MPRNINPGNLTTGTGLAGKESVEQNALVHPLANNDGLRVHITDPSRAHQAAAIGVVDVANNFAADEVEGALAELAGASSLGRTNGILAGCTYTTAGLNLTMDGGSTILHNGTDADISGDVVALANNTTNYVFVNAAGILTATTVLPALGAEPILIGLVITAGGVTTSEQDLRFFVVNIDRKPPLTLRSDGSAANSTAEGAFQTLEAAFNYLNLYATAGSSEVETHRIIVRGRQTLSATATVPRDGVILEGDGDAIFVDATGGAPMFSVGSNLDRIQFRNIQFESNNAATVAITGDDPSDLVIERCWFLSGGADFATCIDLGSALPAGVQRLRVRDCLLSGVSGIALGRNSNARITDCRFVGTGGASGSGIGVVLGTVALANTGRSIVRGCRIAGFETGLSSFEDKLTVVDSQIENVQFGGLLNGATTTIRNVAVDLDVTDGEQGFQITGDDTKVSECTILSTRDPASYAATQPGGISVLGGADRVSLTDNDIRGFLSDTSPSVCIFFQSGSSHGSVTGGYLSGGSVGAIRFTNGTTFCTATGVRVEGATYGIQIDGDDCVVDGCIFDLNDDTRSLYGVRLAGDRNKVSNCNIVLTRGTWVAELPHGVRVAGNGCSVLGNTIRGFYNSANPAGEGIQIVNSVENCIVDGNTVEGSAQLVQVLDLSVNIVVSNNNLLGLGLLTGEAVFLSGTAGGLRSVRVTNNNIRTFTGTGIFAEGECVQLEISGNQIDGYLSGFPFAPTGVGIRVNGVAGALANDVSVNDNTVWRCWNGIVCRGPDRLNFQKNINISGNTVSYCGHDGAGTDDFDGAGSVGIGFDFSADCVANSNVIHDIGHVINDAGTPGFAGANVTSRGIYVRNSTQITANDNSVRNCVSDGAGTSDGIYHTQRTAGLGVGQSFTASNIVFQGNRVDWDTSPALPGNGIGETGIVVTVTLGGDDATAIHGITKVSVNDNHVAHTSDGIVMRVGSRSSIYESSISNNQISDTNDDGILIQAFNGGTAGTSVISQILCNGNNINVVGATGIDITCESPGVGSGIEGVSCSGNNIRLAGGAGIQAGSTADGFLRDFSINENRIDSFTWGILCSVNEDAGDYLRFTINENIIRPTSAWGIEVSSTLHEISEISINGNEIEQGSGVDGGGIYVEVNATGGVANYNLTETSIENNRVQTNDSPGIVVQVHGRVLSLDVLNNQVWNFGTTQKTFLLSANPLIATGGFVWHEAIRVQNNQFKGGDGVRVLVEYQNGIGGAGGAGLRNSTISGNTIEDPDAFGLLVDVFNVDQATTPAVRSLRLDDNTISNAPNVGLRLRLGGAINTEFLLRVDNISLCRNKFSDGHTVGTEAAILSIRENCYSTNWDVSDNQFVNCSNSKTTTTSGIINWQVADGGNLGLGTRNVVISGNTFDDCGGSAMYITDQASVATFAGKAMGNWSFTGNIIRGQEVAGIFINAVDMDFSFDGEAANLNVSGNFFTEVGLGTAAGFEHGIYIVGPDAGTLESVSVNNNTFREIGERAIQIETLNDLTGVTVQANLIDNCSDLGPSLAKMPGGAICVWVEEVGSNIVITGNNIRNVNDRGIGVGGNGAGVASDLNNVKVDGNVFYNVGSSAVAVTIGSDVSTEPDIQQVSIDNNIVELHNGGEFGTTSGIYLNTPSANAAVILGFSVCNNVLDNSNGIHSVGGIFVQGGAIISGAISNNKLYSTRSRGIRVSSSLNDIQSLAIVGNSMRLFNTAGLTNIAAILISVGDDLTNLNIANNNWLGTSDNSHGLQLQLADIIRNVSIVGNVSEITGLSSQHIRWDAATSETLVVFVGNSLVGAAPPTTVGVPGITQGVVSGNIAPAGTNYWDTTVASWFSFPEITGNNND